MPRVVSLLPSATEVVYALGAQDALLGVSHECDYPELARSKRVLTRSRLATRLDASSLEIDRAVRTTLHNALSIYEVDEPALAELAPEVIITQDLCDVCAVALGDVRSAVARLAQRDHIEIVCLAPTLLTQVWDDVSKIADAIGESASGRRLRANLERRVSEIAQRAHSSAVRPRVASIEWLEPLMLGGLWMPELIELAGGVPVGVEAGQPAPTVGTSELCALKPDVIVLKPCGFSLQRALDERAPLERLRRELGPSTRLFVTDGNAFFNRPGPRLVESLEILAACLHPKLFADLAERHRAVIVECP
ncbi:MAG TPA: BtuF-related (seleno)protein [Polyangiaceae bacterium]|nr:BtuF-related (seleno)protein [Polyangiaceae bacterium]